MDPEAKKTALRMVPYGIYVLTAIHGEHVVASGVSWVSQTSFDPPLIVVGIKRGSATHEVVSTCNSFALHMLGADQADVATKFFKHVEREGDTIGGIEFSTGPMTGSPILAGMPAYLECVVKQSVELGDHATTIAEVVDAMVLRDFDGRPDDHILTCGKIGEKLFYAG